MVYNTTRESFPDMLVANPFGFTAAQLFEITATAEREAPKVKF
jgi:LemA protein